MLVPFSKQLITNKNQPKQNTRFFITNTFISNARLKLSKNQANAKQHLDSELLVFENY